MIKNKAIHAIVIGACILASSMAGVYADTAAPDTPVSIQIQQVNYDEELLQKQNEIDQYVFEKHAKDFADKGITVTHTGIADGYVEVGITPFAEENANFIHEIFGKDKVKVVEGIQAVPLSSTDIALETSVRPEADAAKEVSPIAAFFSSIWEWIKSIF